MFSASGWPSATATSGFTLTATNVEGLRTGLDLCGDSGRNPVFWAPWSSSVLCVKSTAQRTVTALSGGTHNSCGDELSLDWLAWITARSGAFGQSFAPGQVLPVLVPRPLRVRRNAPLSRRRADALTQTSTQHAAAAEPRDSTAE